MSHFISLSAASTMTALFRSNRNSILKTEYQNEDILPICETFDREAFDTLLAQTGCESIRIYPGMDEEYKIHAIIVAVDSSGADILPSSVSLTNEDDIVEYGNRCPDLCPPSSPLNS